MSRAEKTSGAVARALGAVRGPSGGTPNHTKHEHASSAKALGDDSSRRRPPNIVGMLHFGPFSSALFSRPAGSHDRRVSRCQSSTGRLGAKGAAIDRGGRSHTQGVTRTYRDTKKAKASGQPNRRFGDIQTASLQYQYGSPMPHSARPSSRTGRAGFSDRTAELSEWQA